jgi:hypothetical protein
MLAREPLVFFTCLVSLEGEVCTTHLANHDLDEHLLLGCVLLLNPSNQSGATNRFGTFEIGWFFFSATVYSIP